jgi:hypothetical protein
LGKYIQKKAGEKAKESGEVLIEKGNQMKKNA